MPIPNANFPIVILLSEIDLQCKVVLRAAERLADAAEHWKKIELGIDDGKTAPPIDIIGTCAVLLSAAAAVSRLLFLGNRKGNRSTRIAKRCNTLMALLNQPNLAAVKALAVRNSWEHLDERLDDVLASKTFKSFSEIHVAARPPDPGTFINRHFDPVSLAIRHGPDQIALKPLITECSDLSARVNGAFTTLKVELHDPY